MKIIALVTRVLTLFAAAAILSTAASTAIARTHAFDAKALARYDISYAKCEARFADMQGHRDEAYLNLWRIRADDKSAARLAGVRGGTVYRSERQLVLKAAGAASAASAPFERECQGLWAEYQRGAASKR